jgi:hypothetical protein
MQQNTRKDTAARYPRLLAACQYVAILSRSEAENAIERYQENRAHNLTLGGCEAVCHYGGPEVVIQQAWRNRKQAREWAAERQQILARAQALPY